MGMNIYEHYQDKFIIAAPCSSWLFRNKEIYDKHGGTFYSNEYPPSVEPVQEGHTPVDCLVLKQGDQEKFEFSKGYESSKDTELKGDEFEKHLKKHGIEFKDFAFCNILDIYKEHMDEHKEQKEFLFLTSW